MTAQEAIALLRENPLDDESPLPWRADDTFVFAADGTAAAHWVKHSRARHIAAAVNAAPHLLAEVDALRAQLEALAGLVERWPELDCESWCGDLRCNCGAEDQNLARAAARLALGLGE